MSQRSLAGKCLKVRGVKFSDGVTHGTQQPVQSVLAVAIHESVARYADASVCLALEFAVWQFAYTGFGAREEVDEGGHNFKGS